MSTAIARSGSNGSAPVSDYETNMLRDDDSVSNAELIVIYEHGIEDLRKAIAGMTPEQARARPIAGKWSTLEVIAHVTGSEIYFTDRFERTIAMDRPLLIGVDEKPYPERLNFQALELGEELELFIALRRHATRVLRLQPPESWSRTAVHTETGLITLRQLVFKSIRHVRHHLPFIAQKRAALGI